MEKQRAEFIGFLAGWARLTPEDAEKLTDRYLANGKAWLNPRTGQVALRGQGLHPKDIRRELGISANACPCCKRPIVRRPPRRLKASQKAKREFIRWVMKWADITRPQAKGLLEHYLANGWTKVNPRTGELRPKRGLHDPGKLRRDAYNLAAGNPDAR